MSDLQGPPLNPAKTASGIALDPTTLERVIPASRRKDGSVRKEQKVRAGYVPKEDIGAFRGRRQLEAEAQRGAVPGAARPGASGAAGATPSLLAQDLASKLQANATEEKRKEPKKAGLSSGHNWDSETDDDEPETMEEARRAFGGLNIKDEAAFPALGSKPPPSAAAKKESGNIEHNSAGKEADTKETGSGPEPASVDSAKGKANIKPDGKPVVVETPTPTGTPRAPRSAQSSTSATTSTPPPASPSSSTPVWRAKRGGRGGGSQPSPQARQPVKPHPIQGGRKGPIGLAFPPSIEEYERSEREAASQRTQKPAAARRPQTSKPSEPAAPRAAPEPRVRQPVRMREGGALGAVRNILLQNQAGERSPRPRREREASATPAALATAPTAAPSERATDNV